MSRSIDSLRGRSRLLCKFVLVFYDDFPPEAITAYQAQSGVRKLYTTNQLAALPLTGTSQLPAASGHHFAPGSRSHESLILIF